MNSTALLKEVFSRLYNRGFAVETLEARTDAVPNVVVSCETERLHLEIKFEECLPYSLYSIKLFAKTGALEYFNQAFLNLEDISYAKKGLTEQCVLTLDRLWQDMNVKIARECVTHQAWRTFTELQGMASLNLNFISSEMGVSKTEASMEVEELRRYGLIEFDDEYGLYNF